MDGRNRRQWQLFNYQGCLLTRFKLFKYSFKTAVFEITVFEMTVAPLNQPFYQLRDVNG